MVFFAGNCNMHRAVSHRIYVLTHCQSLKRVEVIEDDENEIMEAVRRMSDRYDFVVTRLVS